MRSVELFTGAGGLAMGLAVRVSGILRLWNSIALVRDNYREQEARRLQRSITGLFSIPMYVNSIFSSIQRDRKYSLQASHASSFSIGEA